MQLPHDPFETAEGQRLPGSFPVPQVEADLKKLCFGRVDALHVPILGTRDRVTHVTGQRQQNAE